MKKTVKQGNIEITLHLKEDEAVDTSKMMKVRFTDAPEHDFSGYPDADPEANLVDGVQQQFELAKSHRRFNEVYHASKRKTDLKQFILEREALNRRDLCRQIDWSPSSFAHWLNGERNIPDAKAQALKTVLIDYGYAEQHYVNVDRKTAIEVFTKVHEEITEKDLFWDYRPNSRLQLDPWKADGVLKFTIAVVWESPNAEQRSQAFRPGEEGEFFEIRNDDPQDVIDRMKHAAVIKDD